MADYLFFLDNLCCEILNLFKSGLGSPTDMSIVKETTHALQSVFPTAELGTFLDFSRKEKEKHLAELTRIVSGIRLFNKNTGQGNSRGIEGLCKKQSLINHRTLDLKKFLDLPSILNEAIKPSLVDIESERAKAQRLAEYYTAILRNEEENTTPKLRGTKHV